VKEEETPKVMIHVEDLWKKYGPLEVLKGLNLDIYEGETLVILGRSGVGKSVLLRQIIGLEEPDQGFVEVKGVRMNKDTLRRTKLKIGMLFQSSALFDSMNVAENTAFYLRQHEKLSESETADRVAQSLKMVGLEDTQKKMPSELSGGMRKRAALARLIVYHPSIILYDEPTTGLDPMTAMQINELINQTKSELNATSVVVTHDIRSALTVGDRLGFHDDGKIEKIAPKKDFFKLKDQNIDQFIKNAIITNTELE
jgi:phospholipid/cholesterol/gamma-HCH transport system ATP-binding protein